MRGTNFKPLAVLLVATVLLLSFSTIAFAVEEYDCDASGHEYFTYEDGDTECIICGQAPDEAIGESDSVVHSRADLGFIAIAILIGAILLIPTLLLLLLLPVFLLLLPLFILLAPVFLIIGVAIFLFISM